MEFQFELQTAINTIENSGYTLHNIPDFLKENILTKLFEYKPDITSSIDEVIQFKNQINIHWRKFNITSNFKFSITSNAQLLDLYKYRDLKFIYNLIVDKNIADFVNNFKDVLMVMQSNKFQTFYVLTTDVPQQVIEPVLYTPSSDGLLEYLHEKLKFDNLIRLYASSFDNRILSHNNNHLIYLDEGRNIELNKYNMCDFTEEAKRNNKIIDSYDSRFYEPPVLDEDNQPKDVISVVETNRTKGLGFFKGAYIKEITQKDKITDKSMIPYELGTYATCLNYMDFKHHERLAILESYNYVKQHAPNLLLGP